MITFRSKFHLFKICEAAVIFKTSLDFEQGQDMFQKWESLIL